MAVSSKCKVNVNQCKYGDIKPTKFDSIPLRTSVPSYCVYYDKPASRKCRSMHITLDAYDQAKIKRTMYLHKAQKQHSCYYYLDIANKRVVKLREYHGGTIKYSQVVHGTKSKALKELSKALSKIGK